MRAGRNIAICLQVVLFLSGCVMGIPDADPPVPKVKPCEIWVIQYPERTAVCISRAEFERYWKPILQ